MRILSIQQVQKFDQIAIQQLGIHSLVLMENAARGACDELERFSTERWESEGPRSAVILCGPGSNGGDGLVMARHLHLRGWKVKVILLAAAEKLSQDAGVNLRILRHTKVSIVQAGEAPVGPSGKCFDELVGFDWIVDALLGTGAKPPLRQPMANWVKASNDCQCSRMAVDIPHRTFEWNGQRGESFNQQKHSKRIGRYRF